MILDILEFLSITVFRVLNLANHWSAQKNNSDIPNPKTHEPLTMLKNSKVPKLELPRAWPIDASNSVFCRFVKPFCGTRARVTQKHYNLSCFPCPMNHQSMGPRSGVRACVYIYIYVCIALCVCMHIYMYKYTLYYTILFFVALY